MINSMSYKFGVGFQLTTKDLPVPQIIFLTCPLYSEQLTESIFARSMVLKLERASEPGELAKTDCWCLSSAEGLVGPENLHF